MKNTFIYDTEVGKIIIMDNGEAITGIYFNKDEIPKGFTEVETDLIKETKRQLEQYFEGSRQTFDIPLSVTGTEFQKNVWKALQDIPYGETKCYSEIAEYIGNPKACRAVGLANNRNPISIIIPCHRVIGKSGKLVGYGGGLHIKEKLLKLEKTL